MTRVLVTGATGFTGRYLVPLLEQAGHEVTGLARDTADIRDAQAVREAVRGAAPGLVVHLAGTPSLPDTERETLFAVNAGGTENLLAACAALPQPPERILLASSCYVYGDTGDTAATEDAPLRPLTEYGRSKLEMEQVACRWATRLPVVIVRPFNYTGVGHGERFLVPKLVRVFKAKGEDVSFVDPGVIRDFSDVRSVAWAYAALLGAAAAGSAYNVCTGVATPLQRLVEILEQVTAHRPLRMAPRAQARSVLVGSPARLRGTCGPAPDIALEATLRWMLDAA